MTVKRMLYKQYKKHYADCQTLPGSYDPDTKSIEVEIPKGRMKPSGVRGKQFFGYILYFVDSNGVILHYGFRATCYENAVKQFNKAFRDKGYILCNPQPTNIQTIF